MSDGNLSKTISDAGGVSRRGLAIGAVGLALAAPALAAATENHGSSAPRDPGVKAKYGIEALFADYAWSYDCHDEELFLSLFTPDAVIVGYPELNEVYRDRESLREWFRFLTGLREKEGDDWQHVAYNHRYDGDGRRCLVYSYATHFNANQEQKRLGVRSAGYFVSECVNVRGKWLFRRFSINHWDRRTPPWKKPLPWAGL